MTPILIALALSTSPLADSPPRAALRAELRETIARTRTLVAGVELPRRGDSDDFPEVVGLVEEALSCGASEVFLTPSDDVRLVRFTCRRGDILVPFAWRGEFGWFFVQREWIAVPRALRNDSPAEKEN